MPGVAYKKDVGDLRYSPGAGYHPPLAAEGTEVRYHDPPVSSFEYDGFAMTSVRNLNQALREVKCAVIVTDHSWYKWEEIQEHRRDCGHTVCV